MLDADHYDLDKVKERILEYLAVRKLKPDSPADPVPPVRRRARRASAIDRPRAGS